jgi:hypothetical protein
MKQIIFFLFILIISFQLNAQRKPFVAPPLVKKNVPVPVVVKPEVVTIKPSAFASPSRDYVMIQIGVENWANKPDSIDTKGISRSFNAYLCYDFPIKNSNFSFAAGAGIASSNIYLKNQVAVLNDTITAIQFRTEPYDYKRFKLNTTYLEAPFELRYFSNKLNRNKGIKAGIGLKVGTLLSSHTKSKRGIGGKPVVEKVSTKRYLESYRYSATLRIGYGNFSLYGQYALSNLFKLNNGPENMKPFQIGICLSGL